MYQDKWTKEIDRLREEKAELLEALKDLISMSPVNDPMYKRQLEAVWQKARAAVAKAERKEP